MPHDVLIKYTVPASLVSEASVLYCQAFIDKLAPFLGAGDRAASFLAASLVPERAFVALRNGALLGIAGFKLDGRGLFAPTLAQFRQEYGVSGLLRLAGLAMVERREHPDILLMDGIAVAEDARGMGIGTRLLQAVGALARTHRKQSVRLDVIDTNTGARRLYERFGFRAQETTGVGVFRLLFPFHSSTRMTKIVGANG